MAEYNENKLTKLGALKALAEKVKQECATKEELTELSGKVNGIKVPTKVSELTNDSKFQKDTEVAATVKAEIAKAGHASFKVVTQLPEASAAEDNVLYLYKNSKTSHYDIYAKVQGEGGAKLELLDDVTVDLSEYSKTAEITELLKSKVDKDGSKVLSTNDYTTDEKNKLKGIAAEATKNAPSTAAPKVAGVANAGSAAEYARGDHVHPAQESVTGNAGTATKLQTPRKIDGISFDGSADISRFFECQTEAAVSIKEIDTDLALEEGASIRVKFKNKNTASATMLKFGEKQLPMFYNGAPISPSKSWAAGAIVDFVISSDTAGIVGVTCDTTYTDATGSASGLMSAADKQKLDGIEIASDEDVNAMLDEVFTA